MRIDLQTGTRPADPAAEASPRQPPAAAANRTRMLILGGIFALLVLGGLALYAGGFLGGGPAAGVDAATTSREAEIMAAQDALTPDQTPEPEPPPPPTPPTRRPVSANP